MAKYIPTDWKDEIVDGAGNIVQKGTPLSAANLKNLEAGVEDAVAGVVGKVDGAVFDEFKTATTTQLADTAKTLEGRSINIRSLGALANTDGQGNFDNAVIINKAISNLGARGGTVFLPPGEYRIGATIKIPNNVTIKGSGIGATILKLNGAANCNVVELIGTTWGLANFQSIQDLTIEGNFSSQTTLSHGIYGAYSTTYVYINNVLVKACNGDGIRFVSSHRNIMKNVVSEYNEGNGVTVISGTGEGTGTATDNHLEMGYITAGNNKGHGFLFEKPVDTKVMHLTATNNGLDGLYINEPLGGWGNMFDMIMCQGNRNGIAVYKGGDININNIAVTGASEHNIKVELTYRASMTNVSSYNGTLSNLFVRGTNTCVFSSLILRQATGRVNPNLVLQTTNGTEFVGTVIVGGLDGIHLHTGANYNTFTGLEVSETLRHGVRLDGSVASVNYNAFASVNVLNVGSATYPDSSGIEMTNSPYTLVSSFRNSDNRATKYVKYGVNINFVANCMINMVVAKGKSAGIYVATTNTTSKKGTEIIEEMYTA